jgi:ubiquitin-protein ligase
MAPPTPLTPYVPPHSPAHQTTDSHRTQGGKFKLLLVLPTEYPFKPPTISFKTRIYHPNITNDDKGSMCIGILKPEAWKPSSKILNVLVAVQDLLREPVPDDALESGAAEKYKNDRKAYDKEARDMTKRWAMR